MKPDEVYNSRPEFADFELKNANLRKLIVEDNDYAASDCAAIAHDRRIHPEATHNQRDVPRWDGSKAQRLLRLDMDEGKHKNTKPMELFKSRPEYYEKYELKVFRGHICQEQRKRKLVASYKNKK
jgi:hypothetical protein